MKRFFLFAFVCVILCTCFVKASADVAMYFVWYDLEDFSNLRTSVLNEDEEGVRFFVDSGEPASNQKPYTIHGSVNFGRRLLERLDRYYLLTFNRELEGLTDRRVRVDVETGSLVDYWYFSDWHIQTTYYPGVVPWSDYTCDDPDFVLETVDGEEVRFKKHSDRNYYLAHHLLSNGKKAVLILSPTSATADISNPPIDKIGKLAFVPFAELTPAIEIAPSDGENASFPWLWIALPVGAVVIAGGAAFVLLRKKRKSSPTP